MPVLESNNTAIMIQCEPEIDDKQTAFSDVETFFNKISNILDKHFSEYFPEILEVNEDGIISELQLYENLCPAKNNKTLNNIKKNILIQLENVIDKDEYFDSPYQEADFEDLVEGDSPYETPMFFIEDGSYVGIIFETSFELEQIEDSCKAASNEMGESAFIELVDYSGNYKYFK